jgi:hypothetical protein
MTWLDVLGGILVGAGAAVMTYRGFRKGKGFCSGCPLSSCSQKNGRPAGVVQEQVLEDCPDSTSTKMSNFPKTR